MVLIFNSKQSSVFLLLFSFDVTLHSHCLAVWEKMTHYMGSGFVVKTFINFKTFDLRVKERLELRVTKPILICFRPCITSVSK